MNNDQKKMVRTTQTMKILADARGVDVAQDSVHPGESLESTEPEKKPRKGKEPEPKAERKIVAWLALEAARIASDTGATIQLRRFDRIEDACLAGEVRRAGIPLQPVYEDLA